VNNVLLTTLPETMGSANQAAIVLNSVFQIPLNRRGSTFAGTQRVVPPLHLLKYMLKIAQYPVVAERQSIDNFISIIDIPNLVLTSFFFYLASNNATAS
jgi:hypothetical protein